jgi:glycosyltransferase involved in cell wall biosynthesis
MSQPKISVIAIFFEMRREAARTLHTLSAAYQRGINAGDFEIIAIDHGSIIRVLDEKLLIPFGPNFRLLKLPSGTRSPAAALNIGVREARGEWIIVLIDGARMLSPGVFAYMARALHAFHHPFVYTIGMHLGPKIQNESMLVGYNQEAENQLIAGINWKENGYDLFSISSVALSSRRGFFSELAESNCFGIRRDDIVRMEGYDERFQSPGGGLANHDFFNRAMMDPLIEPVLLLGEASFHQFHFGVSTNVPLAMHPFSEFSEEYRNIRGRPYSPVYREPHYLGHAPTSCRHLFQFEVPSRNPAD